MDGPCTSWDTPFMPVTDGSGSVCIPPGVSLIQCTTMTDGVNSLWYANRTLSATNTTEYNIGTFFSYTANMPSTAAVTFEINSSGIGFYYSDTSVSGPVYFNGSFESSLCLRSTFPFLALVRNGSISWNETTNPPFYLITPSPTSQTTTTATASPTSSPETTPSTPSNVNRGVSGTWPYVLAFSILVVLYYVWRGRVTDRYTTGSLDSSLQPVVRGNGQWRPDEEALPAYQPAAHEMGSIIVSPHLAARSESYAGVSVASGRVSVAPSATGSEVLLLENWSVEEVAAWIRLNGAGRVGAEKVREIQMDGGMLMQLTVEEILQVFSLEDDYEKDKLREALAVLKADSGESPPVYV
ncbi:hypothetical protein HDU81_002323 [Chytriomyces hyalinus]|nr:hypothetical protein HDU81_002323 [Chytriomyces hyalinus]